MNKPAQKSSHPFLRVVRLLIGVLPIIWIVSQLKIDDFWRGILNSRWWTLPVLTFFFQGTIFLQAYRWWRLLKNQIPDIALSRVLRAHYIGSYYSLVLPSSASLDVVRTLHMSKEIHYGILWGATLLSRLMGLGVLLFFSLYGLLKSDLFYVSEHIQWALPTFGIFLLLITIISFSKTISRPLGQVAHTFLPTKISSVLSQIREAIYRYRQTPWALLELGGISIILQGTVISTYLFSLYGITGHFYLYPCLAFVPVIEILCIILPITPNGVGIRETLLILFFKNLGVSLEELAIYISISYLVLLTKAFGGLALIGNRSPKET